MRTTLNNEKSTLFFHVWPPPSEARSERSKVRAKRGLVRDLVVQSSKYMNPKENFELRPPRGVKCKVKSNSSKTNALSTFRHSAILLFFVKKQNR